MAGMVALLGREPRCGAEGDLVGMLGGHVQDHLVGAVPVPLRPRMGHPAPRHGPRAWLRHDGLREGEIPRKQHVEAQVAGGQGPTGHGSRSVTASHLFLNDTGPTEIYPLALLDAVPASSMSQIATPTPG